MNAPQHARPVRVVVGISGGVDSSVAALELVQQGHDVHGVFMKNWEETFEPGFCSAAEDLRDAEDVCRRIGIPLHRVEFVDEYRERVFSHFLEEYRRGRTPNPDILCNTEIKFRAFLKHAEGLGAEFIATGHYARRITRDGRHRLLAAVDTAKDQSYFLHGLDQAQLARAVFPLGGLTKRKVRARAREAGLVTFDKKDSTGVCFIGERNFGAFLAHYLPARPGPMVSSDGEQLGLHRGLMHYTLGQRQGLGIGGRRGGSGAPWFVVGKNLEHNTLIVAQGVNHPDLYHGALVTEPLHWIAGEPPPLPGTFQARIRYRQRPEPCTVLPADARGAHRVEFVRRQRAITPGQYLVLYDDEECLGGGVIAAPCD